MNKKIILSLLATTAMITACDDDYMKQFDKQDFVDKLFSPDDLK